MARYEHLPIFKAVYDLTLKMDRRNDGWLKGMKGKTGNGAKQSRDSTQSMK